MDAFVLIDWVGSSPVLREPATIWLAELDDPGDDSEGFTSERELYEQGWRPDRMTGGRVRRSGHPFRGMRAHPASAIVEPIH
jgi:hypothetical protein